MASSPGLSQRSRSGWHSAPIIGMAGTSRGHDQLGLPPVLPLLRDVLLSSPVAEVLSAERGTVTPLYRDEWHVFACVFARFAATLGRLPGVGQSNGIVCRVGRTIALFRDCNLLQSNRVGCVALFLR